MANISSAIPEIGSLELIGGKKNPMKTYFFHYKIMCITIKLDVAENKKNNNIVALN